MYENARCKKIKSTVAFFGKFIDGFTA